MRSFKDYSSSTPSDREPTTPENPTTATELAAKLAKAWNGKSSREMLMQILSEAEKSKRQGTLSNAEIDEFYEQFSPLLSSAERRQLKTVVEKLKKI